MKMMEHFFTIGLFDKDTEKQEISTDEAKTAISKILIDDFGVYAFTMLQCDGVYKMQSSGSIVKEPSIRIEIASEDITKETAYRMIKSLKTKLNQESIMYKVTESEIEF